MNSRIDMKPKIKWVGCRWELRSGMTIMYAPTIRAMAEFVDGLSCTNYGGALVVPKGCGFEYVLVPRLNAWMGA